MTVSFDLGSLACPLEEENEDSKRSSMLISLNGEYKKQSPLLRTTTLDGHAIRKRVIDSIEKFKRINSRGGKVEGMGEEKKKLELKDFI